MKSVGLLLVASAALLSCATGSGMAVGPFAHDADASSSAIGTRAQRRALFDQVWNRVDARYYDAHFNGADWISVKRLYAASLDTVTSDASMHRLLARMVGELHDAHSRYLDPSEAAAQIARTTRGIGATVSEIDGAAVITVVADSSPASRAGLRPGMRVSAVDGENIDARIARLRAAAQPSSTARATEAFAWRRSISGADTAVTLAVDDGKEARTLTIRREVMSTAPRLEVRRIDDVLYLRFDSFRRPIADELRAALRADTSSRGVVLDMRYNGGGDAMETLRSATAFTTAGEHLAGEFHTRVPKVRFKLFRSEDRTPLTVGGSTPGDHRPLVLLTSVASGSGAEMLSAILQEDHRAIVVGDTTCGCLTAVVNHVKLPGGGMLMLSDKGFRTARGTVIEGRGVIPDMVVRANRADLLENRDVVLDRAVDIIHASHVRRASPNSP